MAERNWFTARLLFESTINPNVDDDVEPLMEQSMKIFHAKNVEEAMIKAVDLGKKEEHSYKNDQEQTVEWKFVEVLELQDIDVINGFDGLEVYSILFRKNEGCILDCSPTQ